MRESVLLAGLVGLLLSVPTAVAGTTLTFEEFRGRDAAPISTFYDGITFMSGYSGLDWVARDATSHKHNVSSWPSRQAWLGALYWIYDEVGATTALDYTGNDGIISFDNQDATYVELGYCAGSELWLLAYDSGGNLIDQDSGPANRRYLEGNESGPGTLRVDWDGVHRIAYVNILDTGHLWVVDNITTDASGITLSPIPAPGALLLSGMGATLVGCLRRCKRLSNSRRESDSSIS